MDDNILSKKAVRMTTKVAIGVLFFWHQFLYIIWYNDGDRILESAHKIDKTNCMMSHNINSNKKIVVRL